MGTRGPVPKDSNRRIRRNKEDSEGLDVIQSSGVTDAPSLGITDPHHLVAELYDSVQDSAYAHYYEPSDWMMLQVNLEMLDRQLKSSKPSAQMVASIYSMFSNLLVTEGDRRRVKLEIERGQAEADVIDVANMFRERLAQ